MKAQIKGREVSINRVFDAPVELVWRAFTESDLIIKWWGPAGFTNTLKAMEVVEGGIWEFVMHGPDGTDFENKYIYEEVEPFKKLVMKEISEANFSVVVEFESMDNKTQMLWKTVGVTEEFIQNAVKNYGADKALEQNMEKLENILKQLK